MLWIEVWIATGSSDTRKNGLRFGRTRTGHWLRVVLQFSLEHDDENYQLLKHMLGNAMRFRFG